MLLAIDVGNTNVTLGSFRNGALVATRRTTSDPNMTADELELRLTDLLRLDDAVLADVSAIACASVVPSLTRALEAVAERHERPLLVASAGTVPLPVRVDRPGEDGAFVGGAIAPGLVLGMEALAARTAKLPRVELKAPDRAIGRDTVSAIQSGTVLGYRALVTGLLARIRRELADAGDVPAADIHAILTGGLSSGPWAADLEGIDAVDPELTLKGLAILHAEVAGGQPLQLGLP